MSFGWHFAEFELCARFGRPYARSSIITLGGSPRICQYVFSYLTSARELVDVRRSVKAGAPLILASPAFHIRLSAGDESTNENSLSGNRLRFTPLPDAAEEAEVVRQTLNLDEGFVAVGKSATKGRLFQAINPFILHIATHGFFVAGQDTTEKSEPEGLRAYYDPLIRSGLALAGANREGMSGVLTALEAAGLELSGTELVVLSGCETALGDSRSGEGVYGFRRTLSLAGAHTVVMSSWRIDDTATRFLMQKYYVNLIRGMGRATALRRAQLDLMRTAEYSDPYYWASFISSGATGPLDLARLRVFQIGGSPRP
jgi:CHAT domain-containing protein